MSFTHIFTNATDWPHDLPKDIDDAERRSEIDKHKDESVSKAKDGKGEWKKELASSSEAAVCLVHFLGVWFLHSGHCRASAVSCISSRILHSASTCAKLRFVLSLELSLMIFTVFFANEHVAQSG